MPSLSLYIQVVDKVEQPLLYEFSENVEFLRISKTSLYF